MSTYDYADGHPTRQEICNAGYTDLSTFANVGLSTDVARLMDVAELCAVDPADSNECVACAAYLRAQAVEEQKKQLSSTGAYSVERAIADLQRLSPSADLYVELDGEVYPAKEVHVHAGYSCVAVVADVS